MGFGFAVTAAAAMARNTQARKQREKGFIDCDGKWESVNREFGKAAARVRYTMVEKCEEMA
jgi:hypothetical protein